MSQTEATLDIADVFRRRAWQAEAEARRATDEVTREVLTLVAETWRELALSAARRHRRREAALAKSMVAQD
ncbi:hypothetical protein LJR219_002629 [Phenylobacterium sp. LjRoot219]|uniref:hypothetical protein n=1 Tax=Phenylobacterium sp. LjRoot219 TaxID=3342283 RepID=UPI003ECEDC5E